MVHATRNHLMTGQNDRLNVLDTPVDNISQSIQIRHELKGIAIGSTLCIDMEEMYVLQTSGSVAGSTVTVLRGMNGSTAVAHSADVIVRVNPQFTNFKIVQAVNGALDQLSAEGLFQVKTLDLDFNPAISGYPITAPDLLSVWKVRYDQPGASNEWPVLFADQWEVDPLPDPTDYPGAGAVGLTLRSGGRAGHKVRVSYFAGFSNLTNLADDVTAVSGLHQEAHRIVPVAAAIRLLSGREVKRSFLNRQTDRRLTEEVPPGAALQSMESLLAMYTDWVRQEARRLKKKYPRQS